MQYYFPKPRGKQCKNGTIAPDTYDFLQLKYEFVERSNALGRFQKFQIQFKVFNFWRGRQNLLQFTLLYGFSSRQLIFAKLGVLSQLFSINQVLDGLMHYDYVDYLRSFDSQLDDAVFDVDYTRIFHLLKVAAGVKTFYQNASSIVLEDGQQTHNIVDTKNAFRQYFTNLFFAESSTFENLLKQYVETKNSSNLPKQVVQRDNFLAPSIAQLVRLYASTKEGKAIGNDLLGGEVFKAAPEQMAFLFFPLHLKSFSNIKIPLQDCGGECLDLYKGKGDVKIRKSYRDVLLSNENCKHIGKILRPKIFMAVSDFVVPTQFGAGLNKGSTSLVRLHTAAIEQVACINKYSVTHIFVDFATAYAATFRETILGTNDFETIWKKLKSFGFNEHQIFECLGFFFPPTPCKKVPPPICLNLFNRRMILLGSILSF